ncbi:MAG: hypothetical protein HYR63_12550 [Proteobacteria bacterium]|nr:hypothetical protein [Pseudomonadota bacterium]MBI3499128.1 hypothetical protein [Pseudomonadota bacterium]
MTTESSPMRHLIASLILAALAGCASDGPIRTVNYSLSPEYARDYLQWAAAPGPVWLQLRDAPFPGADAAAAATIADASSQIPSRIRARFTANPAEAGQPQVRVVYTFYPALSVTSAQICDDSRILPHRPPGDRLELMVAFCFERNPVAAIGVSAPPVAPGDTMALRQVAQRVTFDLFTDHHPGSDNANPIPRRGM